MTAHSDETETETIRTGGGTPIRTNTHPKRTKYVTVTLYGEPVTAALLLAFLQEEATPGHAKITIRESTPQRGEPGPPSTTITATWTEQ